MSMLRTLTIVSVALALTAVTAAEPPVLRYVPKHEELKYTFGRQAPTHRIKPGTRIISWTEDCFDGALTKPGQKASEVLAPGHDNPQTGPFYIEGAEPGDTLVIRIEKLEPARDYGVSVAFPGFGALKGTDKTAMLGPDLPETVWDRGPCCYPRLNQALSRKRLWWFASMTGSRDEANCRTSAAK